MNTTPDSDGTLADTLLWEEMGSHKLSGNPLAYGEKYKLVARALHYFPHKSQVAIAEQVGCHQTFVGQVKRRMVKGSWEKKAPSTRRDNELPSPKPPRSLLPPPQCRTQAATTTEQALAVAEHNTRWARGMVLSLVKKGHLDVIRIDGRNWYRLRGEEK